MAASVPKLGLATVYELVRANYTDPVEGAAKASPKVRENRGRGKTGAENGPTVMYSAG